VTTEALRRIGEFYVIEAEIGGKPSSLAFSATTNASGGSGSSVRINFLHSFDKASTSASQPTFKKGNAS
jgi:hypothetical protein